MRNEALLDNPSGKNAKTQFVVAAVFGILVAALVCGIAIVLWLPDQRRELYPTVAMAIMAAIAAAYLRLGRLDASINVLTIGTWLTTMAIAFGLDGLSSPMYYALPVLITFVGWVKGGRAAIVIAGWSVVATILLITAHRLNWLSWQNGTHPVDTILLGIVQATVQAVAAVLVYFLVRAYALRVAELKKATGEVEQLAFFDPLTNLPNRRLLMDRLDHAIKSCLRNSRTGALIFIDLDNFKLLNDSHGHAKGDRLLVEVARRLVSCVREVDTVSRHGGDEFVVIVEDLPGLPAHAVIQADLIARKILEKLGAPYQLDATTFHTTSSIGVTLIGTQREGIDEPLKRADMAMYQAKDAGRNAVCFFNPKMQSQLSRRTAMERDLRAAIDNDQLTLHYQPQVTDSGVIRGVEALARWMHPDKGMISPVEFIPLAEVTGLIIPLGNRVLALACQQLARWQSDPYLSHLKMAVNVSSRQFQDDNFVNSVLEILLQSNAPARRLKLELTETVLAENVSAVIEKMSALKTIGIEFSLDDFGTGYSSLSYLKRLPLNELKIDKSFVRDILVDANDAAIARMVVVLAETLGLSVVAEGVETVEQRRTLLANGCSTYQGYLFSPPLPADDLKQWCQLFEPFTGDRDRKAVRRQGQ